MPKCPDCNDADDLYELYGDGVCSNCFKESDDDSPLVDMTNERIGKSIDCIVCDGTGICQTCKGSGEVE